MLFYSVFAIVNDNFINILLYHYVVGGIQLASFLIRFLSNGMNHLFLKIYAILVMPVWISLIAQLLDFPFDDFWAFFLYYGFVSCPIVSLFYPIYCFETYRKCTL